MGALMLSPEVLNMIAQFMARVDLKGAEVPAFNKCMEALQREMQPQKRASDMLNGGSVAAPWQHQMVCDS